ncbi:MAG: HNH endonuclease family protein [Jatrophihabitans sp.]|uniref:HNH endonuclease family protein n=1 Tax=Jatrophihabitans sp. TaxID=1932789 RepID=UPI003F7F2104
MIRAAAAAGALLVVAGCTGVSAPITAPPPSSAAPSTASSSSAAPAGTALAALGTLPVKGRAPMTGYDRALFGTTWTDDNDAPDGHNGCDTRNDILRRDLTDLVIKPDTHGCVALAGTLHDPYTGRVIDFVRGPGSIRVQIDHVVALGDAWQTGAQQLALDQRVALANDPLELLAVDGPTNQAKGDGDAATWLPPDKGFRCAYVARQVAVKRKYHLWVTPAEHDAIARVLARCPDQPLPSD